MKPNTSNPAKPPPMANSIRVLLVDDSPLILRALTGFMAKQHRFQVVGSAADGRQAVLAAASLAPQLVVVDLHLPHLNGVEVTRCLKEFENPPVVFMVTSDDSPGSRAMSLAAGADAFLVKSGDLDAHLQSKLQQWFAPNTSLVQPPAQPCLADRPALQRGIPR